MLFWLQSYEIIPKGIIPEGIIWETLCFFSPLSALSSTINYEKFSMKSKIYYKKQI